MVAREVIRRLVGESGTWSQNRVGAVLGLTPQAMSNRMQRGSMAVGFVADVLGVLGYDLVAVPRGSRLPNGSVRIDGDGRGV